VNRREYLIWKCRIYYFIIYKREMVKGVGVESMQAKVRIIDGFFFAALNFML